MNFARACFSREDATETLCYIIKRKEEFLVPWLTCMNTWDEMEKLASMYCMDYSREGHLEYNELFTLLDKFEWTNTMLQWLVRFLGHSHLWNNVIKRKVSPVTIPFEKVTPYLRAIIQVHQQIPNQTFTASECVNMLNHIWDHLHQWRYKSNVNEYTLEPREQRHRRIKTTIDMALELNYPVIIDTFIWEWPPDPPKNTPRKPLYSEMERLNILYGSLSAEKLYSLAKNAPASMRWLRDIGFGPAFRTLT
jgi:hypothetical protein